MTTQLALQTTMPTGNIDAYITAAYQLPMLSLEEEQSLAKRLRENDDLDAARQLVMSHLRFVIRIARGYSGYGLALPDLIQEGSVGLMKAVRRFNPEIGVRLVSFAVHWIKAEIHEFVLKNWRIVKVATTKAQRKLFFNLRSSKKRLGWFTQAEVEGVAKDLGVKPKTVLEMEARLSNYDMGFDAGANDDDDNFTAPSSYLVSPTLDPAVHLEREDTTSNNTAQLHQALSDLDERSRNILSARWLSAKKATLHELADEYGVSAERIRQIEKRAMEKMKSTLII